MFGGKTYTGDVALFWDFGSLPQPPRMGVEDRMMDAACTSMHIFYAHWEIAVFRLDALPPGDQGSKIF